MTDIRSKQNFLDIPPVQAPLFQVNNSGFSFSVDLSWTYVSDISTDIIGFKVYKANMGKSLLTKPVTVTQRTLERTSPNKSAISTTNLLYNKSLFSQNSMVKILNSNSDKYKKEEASLSEYSFQSIAFIVANKDKSQNNYNFSDRNIKFGESYLYYVTAVTKTFKETLPNSTLVPVEFVLHPGPPSYLKTSETSQGILLIFGTYEKNISDFVVLRRAKDEENFKIIAKIEANTNHQYFTDIDVFPKKTYSYRIFCRDIWGNVSLTSAEKDQSFIYVPLNTSLENQPTVSVTSELDRFNIVVKKRKDQPIEFVKIERKDEWRKELDFEVKSFDGFPYPASLYFNENSTTELADKSVTKDRSYSYRITAFNKNGFVVSYVFVNNISLGESFFTVDNFKKRDKLKPKLRSFAADVLNKNQKSPLVKCEWSIEGDWSHIVINNGVEKHKIDNIHKIAYLKFAPNKKHTISVEVYDLDLLKVEEIQAATINL